MMKCLDTADSILPAKTRQMPAANKQTFQLNIDNQSSPQYLHICFFVRYKYV